MDKHIAQYILQHKVLTLATSYDNVPYCANCYYAFDATNNILVFLSDSHTRHMKEALVNKNVAGTIAKEVEAVNQIQGVQFTGLLISPGDKGFLEQQFYDCYYQKFPFARELPSKVWGIQLKYVKMTDNTLGFGKKLIWEK